METQICKNCTHFRQHYTVDAEHYSALNCGHCTWPRIKHRKPDSKACEHFVLQTEPPLLPNRRSVVHFLHTRFLEYIMEMPLPPEREG